MSFLGQQNYNQGMRPQLRSLILCTIDFVEFCRDGAHLFYQLGWLQYDTVQAVTEQDAAGIKQVGDVGGDSGRAIGMGLHDLAGEMFADLVAGDDGTEMVAKQLRDSTRSTGAYGWVEHLGAAGNDVIETKAQFFVPVDAPARQVDVPALEDQGTRLNDVATLFAVASSFVDKLYLLAAQYR